MKPPVRDAARTAGEEGADSTPLLQGVRRVEAGERRRGPGVGRSPALGRRARLQRGEGCRGAGGVPGPRPAGPLSRSRSGAGPGLADVGSVPRASPGRANRGRACRSARTGRRRTGGRRPDAAAGPSSPLPAAGARGRRRGSADPSGGPETVR